MRTLHTTLVLLLLSALSASAARKHLNVLLITADDMNYDAPGFTGNKLPGITPNLDRLASQGMWFAKAHVTVAVCQPSRECLMTGRYPHRNGATGFYPVSPEVPTLQELLKAAGYYLGIMGKASHLAPRTKFPWDFCPEGPELKSGRDPAAYYSLTRQFLRDAKAAGKPFFLMANSHDPHRPFAGSEQQRDRPGAKKSARKNKTAAATDEQALAYPPPRRIFSAAEIPVPGFLPDLPDIRTETAQYYSSVNRCDETAGQVLRALEEEGLSEDTLVMFLSDNGMSLPFAKSNCYLTSTRTPWLVRWPGKVKPGTVERERMISGIDYMPTILEAAGLPEPKGMDGRSFLPLLLGKTQDGRSEVFTCYNETSARRPFPMRCLQSTRYGYIYNAWADGTNAYSAESFSGLTFKALTRAAEAQPLLAERVRMLRYRVPEEFYDLRTDPHAMTNLVNSPEHQAAVREMRKKMLVWMTSTLDPLASAYQKHLSVEPVK